MSTLKGLKDNIRKHYKIVGITLNLYPRKRTNLSHQKETDREILFGITPPSTLNLKPISEKSF